MDQLVNFIIRPPRADYSPKDDLLDEEFMLKGRWFRRKDLEVTNGRGKKLQCSHYMPLVIPEGKSLPCVIYCHGNSGCRADASEAAIILLPSNITVFTLDFSGSGLSEGEHVTLGWNEREDLRAVVDYLRTDGNISCIGLWGRSMGAVTSLMYGAEDPSIAGMVLDSPFSNLVDLMMELVDTYKYPLPKFTVKLAIQHMRKIIKKKANFDIMDLDSIPVAQRCFVPALLGHATDDDFIRPHHSDRIYESYMGDKNIIKFDGDHNSPRPQFYFDSITIFFINVLNPPTDMPDDHYYDTMHNYFDQGPWDTMHDIEYENHNFVEPPAAQVTTTTEDAIAQLRSRRLMSRTEVPSGLSTQEGCDASEEKVTEGGVGPSSSRVCPTNLSNDHPERQLTSPTAEDGEYLEYSFDGLSEIPCTVEDEQRMIMEAIILSLKDLERTHMQTLQSNTLTDTSQSHAAAMKDSVVPSNLPPETTGNCNSVSASNGSANGASLHSEGSETAEVATTNNTASSDPVVADVCSALDTKGVTQDADTSGGTRATLVVQKNRASNIMDGLTHRLGLSFFRSSG
uniref:Serine aminopeptidase S33 domain-containing protein n=1 Tax=Ananas comosus var. bracteatus TaxID=296719 RepID=A0A6V7PS38_ANACO|nr:unnamed protein product [Ananas comosus var. bracteatus]